MSRARQSECCRSLKKDGFRITNTSAVKPTTVTLTGSGYDAGPIAEYLQKKVADGHLMMVDGDSAAAALGNPRVLNVVLLGAAVRTGALGLTEEDILNVMGKVIEARSSWTLTGKPYGWLE